MKCAWEKEGKQYLIGFIPISINNGHCMHCWYWCHETYTHENKKKTQTQIPYQKDHTKTPLWSKKSRNLQTAQSLSHRSFWLWDTENKTSQLPFLTQYFSSVVGFRLFLKSISNPGLSYARQEVLCSESSLHGSLMILSPLHSRGSWSWKNRRSLNTRHSSELERKTGTSDS